MLFDHDSGALQAVLDGELVTKWKTTADSLLGARLLGPKAPKRLLILGAGTVANYQIDAFCSTYPNIERVEIWNRTIARAEQLAARHSHRAQTVTACTDLADAATRADIISCATMSEQPLLHGKWVSKDCHVDLIGAYLPHMREADDELIQNAALYVDSRRSTLQDIGELYIPLSSGAINVEHVLGDYYDLCNGQLPIRDPNTYTVFKNGGGGHLDLMCARHIYDTWKNVK